MTYYGFGSSLIIGKVMGHLVNTITSIIDDRKDCMKKLEIGSIHPDEPRMVWISLLSRPHYEKMLSLKRKYNEVLEETLTLHNNTYFLDVEGAVKPYEFDRNNHLTCDGKVSLWRFIDQMLKRFDRDQIGLKLRKVVTEANQRQLAEKSRFILPCPPPVRSFADRGDSRDDKKTQSRRDHGHVPHRSFYK